MRNTNASPTLDELCVLVSGTKLGHSDVRFTGIASLSKAKHTEIGVLFDYSYLHAATVTHAGALITSEEFASKVPDEICKIIVENPREAMTELMTLFYGSQEELEGKHPTAVVAEDVKMREGFYAGPYVVVESGVTVGRGVKLHPHVVIQRQAVIGDDVVIHSHAVIHSQVRIGNRVRIQSGSRIGGDGFGYTNTKDGLIKVPHIGGCTIGDDVEVGANTCVDRGSLGDTEIHEGVKIDNLVHIAHNVVVGSHSLIAAQVGIAGSTKLGVKTIWGGQSGAAGHLEIGDRTEIAAKTGVTEDCNPNSKLAGFPARSLQSFLKGQAHLARLHEIKDRIKRLELKLNTINRSDSSSE